MPYKLVIPNKEVREVFVLQIQEWFKAVVAKDDDTMKLLSRAILDKDEKQIARQLNIVMSRMISILDTKASDDMKENFYHGLLIGLLRLEVIRAGLLSQIVSRETVSVIF